MTQVILNKHNGGLGYGKYQKLDGISSETIGFDFFKYSDRVSPHSDKSDERLGSSGGTLSVSVVDACSVSGSAYEIIGVAKYDNGATGTRFVKKYDTDPRNNFWTTETNCTGSANPNFCIAYKGYAYANGGNVLYKRVSSGSVSTIGTMTTSGSSNMAIRALVHSQDNVLYMSYGDRIQKYDGTTFTAGVLTLPYLIYAIEEYGQYLAIFCNKDDGTGVCFLWGRDTSLATLQDSIPIGQGTVKMGAVLDGVLFTVSEVGRAIYVRAYIAGVFKQIKVFDFPLPTNESLGLNYYKRDNKLYFNLNRGYSLCVGANADGEYIVSPDRNFISSGETPSFVWGMFAIPYNGSVYHYMGVDVVSGSTGTLRMVWPDDGSVENSISFYNNARYTTAYNPKMFIEDLTKNKILTKVRAKFFLKTPSAGGTFTLSYETDQSGTFTTIEQKTIDSNVPNIYILEASAEGDGKPFATGKDFRFRLTTASGKKVDLHQLEYEYEPLNTLI